MALTESGNEVGGTSTRMTDDQGVRTHSLQIQYCIFKTFSLDNAACCLIEVDDVSTQSFGCQFEGTPSPCAWFEKEVNDCLPSQGGYFFDIPGGNFEKRVGCAQQSVYFRNSKRTDSKKMLLFKSQGPFPLS
jgi:hypothetical protein